MLDDIGVASVAQTVKNHKSSYVQGAEWLAKKKKLRDAWLTSQHKTTTTTAPPSDRASTILFAVLGFLALITIIALVTWAVKRNVVKQQRKRDREVQEHQELLEQSIRSRLVYREVECFSTPIIFVGLLPSGTRHAES
ncbi:hypothetical protein RB195_018067 [Necator americanus]|uniref:Transmembrane protein n=1 Tax=Necator americanus TaxID=51031 RepID=A0ABR1C813_NECAM